MVAVNSRSRVVFSCQSLQELVLTENLLTVSFVMLFTNVYHILFNLLTVLI